ncbi:PucR family transcriptional regulator [Yinghuangia seranimata]|uniref:PucR family transcriptional regulator n=1 Tax=Yinghuangia seranimata TaxID=408067 RepID=UPI00248C1A64|nr:PucR family transcriptional regulator [Yinghuangia seranimata]MDI2132769.1 PucR family transcriptional regulator [Yinghuangia seranimata]
MPATLDQLVRAPALDLVVLAGEAHLGRAIRWVHTSELADPTPYLEGGELVLTTGMKLGRSAVERRAYVERLADAGVVGLGIGVGLTHAKVPAAVVEAAEERGLPVFAVPRPTPFIAISKMVSSALAADQYESVTTGFAAQQELTRAVLGREGTAALIRRLAVRLDGWAALYDQSGTPVHVSPAAARPRAAALADDVTRLRGLSAPASASLQGPGPQGERVVLQSLGADRRIRGFLAVGTARPAAPADRQILGSATSLLTLALEQSRALGAAEARMRTALLRLWLGAGAEPGRVAAEPGAASAPVDGLVRSVAQDLGSPLPAYPVLVAVAHGPEVARTAFAERLGQGTGVFAAELDDAMVVVAPARLLPDGDTGAFDRATADLPGLAVGVSGESAGAGAEAFRQARQAFGVGARAGRAVTVYGHAGASLLPMLGDSAVRAWADELLAPLYAHDAGGRGDLVASVRAWLARHGQWDAAAGDLGVHRHTLRYRIRRAEEILGRRLDDPDARAELWLALRVAEPESAAAAGPDPAQ